MAATWTAPRTWSVGETVTKSIMDTHVRNNLEWLKTPPGSAVLLNADVNTTSTSAVDLTGASITLTSAGGAICAHFHAPLHADAAGRQATLQFLFDASPTPWIAKQVLDTTSNMVTVAFGYRWTGASAASHTVKVQWFTSAGTITLAGATIASGFFQVGEFS